MRYILSNGELPVQAEQRMRKILWDRARRPETLSISQLIETTASFAASIVGASYQVKGMSIEANRALKRLTKELRRRYRLVEAEQPPPLSPRQTASTLLTEQSGRRKYLKYD